METQQNQTENAKKIVFERKKRVGMSLVSLDVGQSVYAQVTEIGVFTSEKYPDGIDFIKFINLETGEEQQMWADGGLRGATSQMGGLDALVGMKLEIKRGPQKEAEIMNEKGKLETVRVNSYDIWELS